MEQELWLDYIFVTISRGAFIEIGDTLTPKWQSNFGPITKPQNCDKWQILNNNAHVHWHFEIEQGPILENGLKA